MTTIYPFVQSTTTLFSFSPVLDGQTYSATIRWGLFGQRHYLQLTAVGGSLIVNLPVIVSPPSVQIASLSWQYGFVYVETSAPHGFLVGATANITLAGNAPSALNGTFPCFIIDESNFFFPLSADPGMVTTLGAAQYVVNMLAGYFDTSVLYFVPSANQFIVTP